MKTEGVNNAPFKQALCEGKSPKLPVQLLYIHKMCV